MRASPEISPQFFTAIFCGAHLMHSRRRFALETVTVLQYRCPQSGTSLMHTAVAAMRNGSGNNASSGSQQALFGAATGSVDRLRRPWHSQPLRRRTGQFEIRMRFVQAIRGGHVARKIPLSARQQAHSAPCTSAPGWLVCSGERRLRSLRPTVLEPCLIVRSVGGWPADRTSFCAKPLRSSPLTRLPDTPDSPARFHLLFRKIHTMLMPLDEGKVKLLHHLCNKNGGAETPPNNNEKQTSEA